MNIPGKVPHPLELGAQQGWEQGQEPSRPRPGPRAQSPEALGLRPGAPCFLLSLTLRFLAGPAPPSRAAFLHAHPSPGPSSVGPLPWLSPRGGAPVRLLSHSPDPLESRPGVFRSFNQTLPAPRGQRCAAAPAGLSPGPHPGARLSHCLAPADARPRAPSLLPEPSLRGLGQSGAVMATR